MRRRVGPVLAAVVFLADFSASDALAQEKGDPKAGKAIYDAQCSMCHGTAGAGDGPLAQELKHGGGGDRRGRRGASAELGQGGHEGEVGDRRGAGA